MPKFLFFLFFYLALPAWAQVDPSSALLLRPGGRPPAKENLDSSRYTIRPQTQSEARDEAPPRQTPVQTSQSKPVSQSTAKPEPVEKTETPSAPQKSSEETLAESPEGLREQFREWILGGDQEKIEDYKKQIHPKDYRLNMVEVSIAPVYLYQDSQSSYWYRSFHNSSPGIYANAKLWLTPFFGINSSFMTSLGGDMVGSLDGKDRIQVDHQMFDLGLRFRKFFGTSLKSPQLSFGIDYYEHQLRLPPNSPNRIGTKTGGPRLVLDAYLPKKGVSFWNVGVELMPKSGHLEVKTAADVKSGEPGTNHGAGVWIGGLYNFDGVHQMFWKLSHRVEKNIFEGAASLPDPRTGETPEGVSVTNSLTIFSLGYRWGN